MADLNIDKVHAHGTKMGFIAALAALAGMFASGAIVSNNPEMEPAAGPMNMAITTAVAGFLGALWNWWKHR